MRNNTLGEQLKSLNMTALLKDVMDIVHNIDDLAEYVGKLLPGSKLGLQSYWSALTSGAALTKGWTDVESMMDNMKPLMENLQSQLEGQSTWPWIKNMLLVYDAALDVIKTGEQKLNGKLTY